MIKLNKKILSLILALILVFTLSACTEGNNESTLSNSSDISTSEVGDATSKVPNSTETSKKDTADTSSVKSGTSTSSKPTSSKNSSSKPSTTTSQKLSSQNKTDNSKVSPKLYKVTDSKGNVAWLFGSIHVGKKSFFPLPDYVTNALYGSDVLAVEFDLVAFEKNESAQMKALTEMVSPNQSIKTHLTGDDALSLYNKAVDILAENNAYNALLDYYKPALWSMLIDDLTYQKIGAKSEYGIDRYIINRANSKKIKIEDIESAEAQYKMLADFSNECQMQMLNDSIKSYESGDSKKQLDALMDIWATGNYDALRRTLAVEAAGMKRQNPDYYSEYNDAMNVKRDALMTEYVVNALAEGKEAFVCVGAAHIARQSGVVDSLKDKGYKVEEVK